MYEEKSREKFQEFLKIKKLKSNAILPSRAKKGDAGLDLYSCENYELKPGESIKVSLGIAMEVPMGHVGLIADRSSLGSKGLKTFGGVIDSGYRGGVQVIVRNLSSEILKLSQGERVAQMLILPVSICEPIWVNDLESSDRGVGGFGSTGSY